MQLIEPDGISGLGGSMDGTTQLWTVATALACVGLAGCGQPSDSRDERGSGTAKATATKASQPTTASEALNVSASAEALASATSISLGPAVGALNNVKVSATVDSQVRHDGSETLLTFHIKASVASSQDAPGQTVGVCGSFGNEVPYSAYGEGSTKPPWDIDETSGSYDLQLHLKAGCGPIALVVKPADSDDASAGVVFPVLAAP